MADQDVKQLLLQVDASIELLRSNLGKADAAVKTSTDVWTKDANKADASFGNVGKGLNGLGPRLREINNLTKQYGATSAAAAAKAQAMQRDMQAQSDQIAAGLRRSAGLIGAYFSVREITAINDKFTEFTNGLRVAGVEGSQTKVVQDALFASAQKYGIELNSLGTLYGRAAQAASSLGASQSDLLRFSNGVSAALKVQGGSTEEASGALLQLSQLLQSGTVHAEEFNSVNEGAFPILQAVAAGSDKFGGSVAKLRAEVLAGNVTSKEFFQAFLDGSEMLEQRASKAALTAAAGFVKIRNALEVYVGEASSVSGASAAIGVALETIADNINILIPAIAAIGVALGVGFVANAAKAGIAARGAGGALLGAFGGPVGIAITAVTVGLASFAAQSAETAAIARQAHGEYEETKQKLEAAGLAAVTAASGTAAVGRDAATATPKVRSFAGAVGELAQKLYDQAAATKAARIEGMKSQLTTSQQKEQELGAALPQGRASLQRDAGTAFGRGDLLMAAKMTWQNVGYSAASLLSGGRTDRDNLAAYKDQSRTSMLLQAAIKKDEATPVAAADLPGGAPTAPPSANSKALAKHQALLADLEKAKVSASAADLKGINTRIAKEQKIIGYLEQGIGSEAATAAAGGSRSKSAGSLAKQEESARQKQIRDEMAYQAELARGRLEELVLQADATNNQAMRADIERQRIGIERDAMSKEIAADGPGKDGKGRYTEAQAAELQAMNQRIADAKLAAVDTQERRRLSAETLSVAQAERGNQIDLLQGASNLADTTAQRRDLEMRILDLQIAEERARLESVTTANGANETDVKIAQSKLAILDQLRGQAAEKIQRDTASPMEQYQRQLKVQTSDWNSSIQETQVRALSNLTDGLASAGAEYIKLGGIAGNVINGIIQDLIRLATQKAILGALGGGGGILGLFGGGANAAISAGAAATNANSIAQLHAKFGFASGGYTGDVPPDQVAGVVHGKEYVFDAASTARIGVGQLEAIRNGQFNMSSLASSAIRSAGNAKAAGGTVRIEIGEGAMFEPRVTQISGGVSAHVVSAAAPMTAQVGAQQAQSSMTRRARNRIPG